MPKIKVCDLIKPPVLSRVDFLIFLHTSLLCRPLIVFGALLNLSQLAHI